MNRQEHLVQIGGEECNEIAQRLSKINRFGLLQIQQDADDRPEENPEGLTNLERTRREFNDLVAVLEMIDPRLTVISNAEVEAKKAKVERYLLRSRREGTLDRPQTVDRGLTPDDRYMS